MEAATQRHGGAEAGDIAVSSPPLSASVLSLRDLQRRAATVLLVTAWRTYRAAHGDLDICRATTLFSHSPTGAPDLNTETQRRGEQLPLPLRASVLNWLEWSQAHGLRCTRGSLFRYAAALDAGGANADGRGRYVRDPAAGAPDAQGESRPGIDGPAWDLFTSLYLNPNRLTFAACWKFVRGQARERNWFWPSEPSVRRRIRAEIPIPALIEFRRGAKRAEAACIPKIERDIESIAGGEWWCLDGRTLDCWCRVPDDRREWRRMRATVTGVLDLRSRCLRLDLRATECADGILSGIKQALRDWGAPLDVICDNGEGYKAALGHRRGTRAQRALLDSRIGSVFGALGVKLHNAIKYHGWAKPIESIWNKVKRDFDAWLWHYWGGSKDERPEERDREVVARIDDLPTEAELRDLLNQWVWQVYECTEQSGAGTRGLPPIMVMERYRGTIRRVDESVIETVCTRRVGPVKVGRDGVRWHGFRYGQTQEEIFRLQGRDVWLLIDPEHVDRVTLADEAGRPLAVATNQRLSGATQEQLAEAMRHKACCRRIVRAYAPASDYLLETPASQVIAAKARHAAADLEALRAQQAAHGNAPPAEPLVTILRPDLAAPAAQVSRAALRDRVGGRYGHAAPADSAAERAADELLATPAEPDPAEFLDPADMLGRYADVG